MYKGGVDRLCADCKEAGVCGFIMVDLPVEEATDVLTACSKYDLSFVPLLAPTSTGSNLSRARAHTHTHTHAHTRHTHTQTDVCMYVCIYVYT